MEEKSQSKIHGKEFIKIALIGNPNSGKSSLFNLLTGLNQRTGNFPGVTVDKFEGEFFIGGQKFKIIDLPGIYSLTPKTPDEFVAVNVLIEQNNSDHPDLVLYVADGLNLKRCLFLLTQILDLGLPVVVAVTMMDLIDEGKKPNLGSLEKNFGVTFIGLSSKTGNGLAELKHALALGGKLGSPFYRVNLEDMFQKAGLTFIKDYSGWVSFQNSGQINYIGGEHQKTKVRELQVKEIVERYKKIDQFLFQAGIRQPERTLNLTSKIDAILTHPFYGYGIFSIVLFLIFQVVFSFSSYPMKGIEWMFAKGQELISSYLNDGFWSNFLVNGLLAGISGVVVFIPQIALLFFFIALLEDSGYMARVGLLSDRILRVFGLNGRSVISLISGMACAVPAIMGTRTIKSWKERLITILVTPFMSCSARLPVFALLISIAVPANYLGGFISLQALVLLALYLLGFLMALIIAYILSKSLKLNNDSTFAMEMPVYRLPNLRSILSLIINKVKIFVLEAGKVILIISVLLWFLSSYGPSNGYSASREKGASVESTIANKLKLENSYVGILGKKIEPFIKPLGYDWKIGIALITSFAAREVFVGTMATIYSVGDPDNPRTLRQKILSEKDPQTGMPVFSQATAFSLMSFYLFAMQCMSTVAVVYRETKSVKWPLFQFVLMFVLAYLSAWGVFNLFS